MALSIQSDATVFNEKQFTAESPLLPMTTIDQESYEFERKQRLRPDPSIDTGSEFFFGDGPLQLKDHHDKIEFTGFHFNNPWLPSKAVKLLNKLKKAPITQRELVSLMELVAERASIHFQLTAGKFVAMTFHGQIVEVSDTRVGLLKGIQGRKYREQIFVWRIGSNAFSGRI